MTWDPMKPLKWEGVHDRAEYKKDRNARATGHKNYLRRSHCRLLSRAGCLVSCITMGDYILPHFLTTQSEEKTLWGLVSSPSESGDAL